MSDDPTPPGDTAGPGLPDPSTLDPSPRRGRNKRIAMVAAAVVVVAAGAALAAQAFSSTATTASSTPSTVVSPAAAPSAEPSPDPTPTTADPVARPLVAVTATGELVTVDAMTGATDDVVTQGYSAENGARPTLSVTPDGTAVYVTHMTGTDGTSTIDLVSLADGSVTTIGEGWDAAVSPDGTSLAFTRPGTTPETKDVTVLAIRDLATGIDKEIPDTEPSWGERVVAGPTWLADSQHVVLPLGWYDVVSSTSLVVVDVSSAGTLEDATPLTPSTAGSALNAWWSPIGTPGGNVASLAAREDRPDPTVPVTVTETAVRVLDSTSGEVLQTIALPEAVWARSLAAEPDGQRFALVSSLLDAADSESALLVSDGTAPFAPIATGILAVSW